MEMKFEPLRVLGFVVLGVAAAIGIYYLGVACWYLLQYVGEPDNPQRGEYIFGVVLSLVFALPCWLLVSGLTYVLRRSLRRAAVVALHAPGVVLGLAFVLYNAWQLVAILSG